MSYTETFLNYLNSLPDGLIYLLLGVSAFVENIFPPIPGDTITAFGAFLVGIGRLDLVGVYTTTTLGSLAGFMSLFGIGRYLGRRFFMEKDYRFFKAEDLRKAETDLRRIPEYFSCADLLSISSVGPASLHCLPCETS